MKNNQTNEVISNEILDLSKKIGKRLIALGKTMSAAESCTGGMISAAMTAIAGCSEYYLGSVTSYAISVKENVLGVPAETIENYGVVSSETVAAMAEGVRRITGSDYSIATTGIAGPGGASEGKPVGLVWIGFASEMGTKTFKFISDGDRKTNISNFTAKALDIFCNMIC